LDRIEQSVGHRGEVGVGLGVWREHVGLLVNRLPEVVLEEFLVAPAGGEDSRGPVGRGIQVVVEFGPTRGVVPCEIPAAWLTIRLFAFLSLHKFLDLIWFECLFINIENY